MSFLEMPSWNLLHCQGQGCSQQSSELFAWQGRLLCLDCWLYYSYQQQEKEQQRPRQILIVFPRDKRIAHHNTTETMLKKLRSFLLSTRSLFARARHQRAGTSRRSLS